MRGERERIRRANLMFWAYLTFHMRKVPLANRELASWGYLLEWAMLGGKPDELIWP